MTRITHIGVTAGTSPPVPTHPALWRPAPTKLRLRSVWGTAAVQRHRALVGWRDRHHTLRRAVELHRAATGLTGVRSDADRALYLVLDAEYDRAGL